MLKIIKGCRLRMIIEVEWLPLHKMLQCYGAIQNEYEKTANDNLCVLSHDGTG